MLERNRCDAAIKMVLTEAATPGPPETASRARRRINHTTRV